MKLLVLDGNSIFNRAFYGIKLLTTKKGFYTNAIYGFLTMLNKLKEGTNPDAIAIAFDMKAPTFRHNSYKEYKANRKGMPPELAVQFPVLKELLADMGYKLVEKEGYEADDILGTLASACQKSGQECVIATGDRDSLQLVDSHVTVRIAATKFGRPEVTLYDEAKIKEIYGITPIQLIDIKAIQGDSSDNIPGVAGIGEKGAGELIRKFGSIENLYANINSAEIKESTRQKLINSKESAFLSKFLGTIVKDVPIDVELESYVPREMDEIKVIKTLTDLEMFSILKKMGLEGVQLEASESSEELAEASFEVILNESVAVLEDAVKSKNTVDFLIRYQDKKAEGIGFSADKKVYILSDLSKYKDWIAATMRDEQLLKRTYDVKAAYESLNAMGMHIKNVKMDALLGAYLLNPSGKNYELETLAKEYNAIRANVQVRDEEYAKFSQDVAQFGSLCDAISYQIEENSQKKLLEEIELPLAEVLADMETTGFLIDVKGIKAYGEALMLELQKIQDEIYRQVGKEFNINSPKQLGVVLFEELNLPKSKKTKSGYSTSAEVLESIRGFHPVVELILQHRVVTKLKSTYCDGLLKVVEADGRVHSRFNQVETRTGRISSLEPNLQNIPVRTERGKELRRFFVAKEGCVLVDADYSQIELRILAHLAADSAMIDAFNDNLDIHRITASQVFGIPENMVTPIMRSRAKAVNFGIVYGISAFSLAKDIGVLRKDAQTYIDNYLAHYAGVREYMRETIESAKRNKFVETIFGRKRYLPEIASSNFNLRSFGERVARNMPIQGSAADIIKIAMINVSRRLKEFGLKAKLILQVHDELIVEAPESEADEVAGLLKAEMGGAVKLKVSLVAEANIGKTWYDAKQ